MPPLDLRARPIVQRGWSCHSRLVRPASERGRTRRRGARKAAVARRFDACGSVLRGLWQSSRSPDRRLLDRPADPSTRVPEGRPRQPERPRALPESAGEPGRKHVTAPRRQRILSRQQPEGDRNLAAPLHAELLAKHVTVSLHRPGGDSEPEAGLVIRATRCDECDDLALSSCDPGRLPLRCQVDHGGRSYSLVRVTAIRHGV